MAEKGSWNKNLEKNIVAGGEVLGAVLALAEWGFNPFTAILSIVLGADAYNRFKRKD